MKPFLRVALLCREIVPPPSGVGALNFNGVIRTISATVAGATTPPIDDPMTAWIEIEAVDRSRPHAVVLEWRDEAGEPFGLRSECEIPADPECDWIEIKDDGIRFQLDPPRAGRFRLAIELDGELIGWIPLPVLFVARARYAGES